MSTRWLEILRLNATGHPAAEHPSSPAEIGWTMKWNLRLAVAYRGIWTASEIQRLLAAVSAGRMFSLWSDSPASVKLDVIRAVLGCGSEELLPPEPGKVAAAAGEGRGHLRRAG